MVEFRRQKTDRPYPPHFFKGRPLADPIRRYRLVRGDNWPTPSVAGDFDLEPRKLTGSNRCRWTFTEMERADPIRRRKSRKGRQVADPVRRWDFGFLKRAFADPIRR